MQVVVKMPHIKLNAEGDLPGSLLDLLQKEFAENIKFYSDEGEELLEAKETDWYKNLKK